MPEGVIAYRILGLVGEGGFGKVYRARQESSEGFAKEVALKVLTDDEPPRSLLGRFRDEARILGLLRDRAIVRVEPPVLLEGRWAVVMEFVDGISLGALVGREGALPPGVVVEVVGEVARALHNAYHTPNEQGEPLQLLHRDIKPDNIQVTPSGDVRLLDFGIARANFAQREVTTRRSFGGTPGYIAPERPEGVEVAAGDVYSLGVALHECVLGTRPKSPVSLEIEGGLPRIDAAELEFPADLSDDARKTLELAAWMRAYDHEKRPSARQVEDLCRQLRAQLGPPHLREWAEARVPTRVEMPPDERVGHRFEVTSTGTPAPTERAAPLPPPPRPEVIPSTVVVGGMVASSLGIGLVGGVAVMAAAGVAVWLFAAAGEPVAASPAGAAQGELAADAPAAGAEVPPADGADGAPPAPTPDLPPAPPPKPKPREIYLDGTRPPDPTSAAPSAAPEAPAPADGRAVGYVRLRTIPSGGSLVRGGAPVAAVGGRSELPAGTHTLVLLSADGLERAMHTVVVGAGETVDVCYSFDDNRPCQP